MDKTPDEMHLVEEMVASKLVFDGQLMKVYQDQVRLPNGKVAVREFNRHPGAVMIIPVLDDGRVVMERQFRYPNKQVYWEFPAGKCDPGETFEQTAIRELREETGYVAGELQWLTAIHPCIAYSDEVIQMMLARQLVFGERSLDPNEFLDIVLVDIADLLPMVSRGEVPDVKTQIGIFWLELFSRKN